MSTVIELMDIDEELEQDELAVAMIPGALKEEPEALIVIDHNQNYHIQASTLTGRFIYTENLDDYVYYNARIVAHNSNTGNHLLVYDRTWLYITDIFPLMDMTDLWHFAEDPAQYVRDLNPFGPRALEGSIIVYRTNVESTIFYPAAVLEYLPQLFTGCDSIDCNTFHGFR